MHVQRKSAHLLRKKALPLAALPAATLSFRASVTVVAGSPETWLDLQRS
jgi:hypothetical protein